MIIIHEVFLIISKSNYRNNRLLILLMFLFVLGIQIILLLQLKNDCLSLSNRSIFIFCMFCIQYDFVLILDHFQLYISYSYSYINDIIA